MSYALQLDSLIIFDDALGGAQLGTISVKEREREEKMYLESGEAREKRRAGAR